MATEQTLVDSGGEVASVEDRLSNWFDSGSAKAEPESAAEPQQAQAEAGEIEDEQDDSSGGTGEQKATDPDLVEITTDDGEVYQVPAKLKDAFTRTQDYTVKTQEAAQRGREADERIRFAETREKILQQTVGMFAALQKSQAELERYQGIDWNSLYNANPGQALQLREEMRSVEGRIGQQNQLLQQAIAQQTQEAQQHAARLWAIAEKGVRDKLGNVSEADNAAMLAAVKDFSQDEIKTKLADARILHLVWKAAKYDQLQAQKPAAADKAGKAPPIIKAGAKQGAGQAQQAKSRAMRDELRKTGDIKVAAQLLNRF